MLLRSTALVLVWGRVASCRSVSLRQHAVLSVASAGFTPAATGANLKRLAGCIGLSILGSSANVLI